MELCKEILINVLQKEKVQVSFPELEISAKEIVEMHCYEALRKIKAILEDENNTDEECFMKIEGVLNVLEDIGSGASGRHDWC